MPYLRPGETIRLAPPWTETVRGNQGSTSWTITMRGALSPLGPAGTVGANTRGWTVTKVAGNFGQADLEVDVTSPADLEGSFADGSGVYDVSLFFSHYAGTAYFTKAVPFSYTTLVFPNSPSFDVALNSFSEALYSAVLEPEGLRLYKTTLRDGIAAKTELYLIEKVAFPHLWIDSQQHLYCCAQYQIAPGDDPSVWKLWKSTNDGQTWNPVSDLPWQPFPGEAIVKAMIGGIFTGYANGVILSTRQSQTTPGSLEITRSFDSGRTWTPVEDVAGVGFTQRLMHLPESTVWWSGLNRRTRDLGRSFEFFINPPTDPTGPGLSMNAFARNLGANMIMCAGFFIAGPSWTAPYAWLHGKLAFSRSHDWGSTWRPPTFIDDDYRGNMARVGQSMSTGTLYLTNGRDRLFISKNSGQSWEARP